MIESPAGHAPAMRAAHDDTMLNSISVAQQPVADPYEGVALGVECAWPALITLALSPDDPVRGASPAQYTVSTGTPNR